MKALQTVFWQITLLFTGCIRKKHGKSTPVEIIFEDLPTNDFKSLFMHMEGLFNAY